MTAELSGPQLFLDRRQESRSCWRGGWPALAVTALARLVLCLFASLLLCSLIPTLFGWHPTVVMTGSMEPRLHPGDVVVARPVPSNQLRLGQVLLVADPDHPGRQRLHRLAAFGADGLLTLRGDANAANDSSPVSRSAVHGVGALRAPLIGTPKLWLSEGQYADLALLAGVLALVVAAAFAFRSDDELDEGGDPGNVAPGATDAATAAALAATAAAVAVRPPSARAVRAGVRAGVACLLAVALLGVGLPAAAPAHAATRFSGKAATPSSTWSAVPYFTCKAAALAANPFLYYQLGETSGAAATDASGNGRAGTYQGTVTKGVPGSCSRDKSTAVTLDGSTGYISTPTQVSGPNVFTIEIWFKTTTSRGGKLIGFGSAPTGLSGSYDRHLYLANSGQVVFGVYPNAVKTIISPKSYNDGGWHLADATLSGAGMQLYVDGQLVAGDATVTAGQSYSGYWRIGYDNLSGWGTTTPTSNYLAATIDDAAVYPTALSASQIAAQYTAG